MGGQNHQPTNRVLTGVSALLSRHVSDGFARVLTANIHLEDAIIIGMNRLYVDDIAAPTEHEATTYLHQALRELRESADTLDQIDAAFTRMFVAAAREHYTGNPLASRVSSMMLMDQFQGRLILPVPNHDLWRTLERKVAELNVLETLKWEQQEFRRLKQPTEALIQSFNNAIAIVQSNGPRAFVDALEDNRIPFRQNFAQVFSLWNYLQGMFLYSALMMTELYYRANGFPSLLDVDQQRNEVA